MLSFGENSQKSKEKTPYPRSVKGGCRDVDFLATISEGEVQYSGNRGYGDVGFRRVKSELNAPEGFNKWL